MPTHGPISTSRGGVALTTLLPNGEPNGSPVDATLVEAFIVDTPSPPPHGAGMNAEVAAAVVLRRSLKGGNINQGYAQCDVDRLAIAIEKGQCSVERIQCRQMATLKTLALAGLATVEFEIRPVGPAFARELIVAFSRPDGAPLDFTPIVTQIASKGRTAVTGRVTSSVPASNVGAGFPVQAFAGQFQNYVLSSGIIFDSANNLVVTVQNFGADPGSFLMGLTYDLIRMG